MEKIYKPKLLHILLNFLFHFFWLSTAAIVVFGMILQTKFGLESYVIAAFIFFIILVILVFTMSVYITFFKNLRTVMVTNESVTILRGRKIICKFYCNDFVFDTFEQSYRHITRRYLYIYNKKTEQRTQKLLKFIKASDFIELNESLSLINSRNKNLFSSSCINFPMTFDLNKNYSVKIMRRRMIITYIVAVICFLAFGVAPVAWLFLDDSIRNGFVLIIVSLMTIIIDIIILRYQTVSYKKVKSMPEKVTLEKNCIYVDNAFFSVNSIKFIQLTEPYNGTILRKMLINNHCFEMGVWTKSGINSDYLKLYSAINSYCNINLQTKVSD